MTTSFRHPTFGRLIAERTDNGWGLTAAPAEQTGTDPTPLDHARLRDERDRYRHALEVIANARADHVAAGLIYTARKALGRE